MITPVTLCTPMSALYAVFKHCATHCGFKKTVTLWTLAYLLHWCWHFRYPWSHFVAAECTFNRVHVLRALCTFHHVNSVDRAMYCLYEPCCRLYALLSALGCLCARLSRSKKGGSVQRYRCTAYPLHLSSLFTLPSTLESL